MFNVFPTNSHQIIEHLELEGTTKLMESKSWLHTKQPKLNHVWEHCPKMSWTPTSLVSWPVPWGACCSSWPSSQWRTFPKHPTWTSPVTASWCSLKSCHWSPEIRGHLPPLCFPLWGSSRQPWGHPWAFPSLSWQAKWPPLSQWWAVWILFLMNSGSHMLQTSPKAFFSPA